MSGQLLQRFRVGVLLLILILTMPAFTWASAQTDEEEEGFVPAALPLTSAFSYQGELQDEGLPASGVYDFAFRLYDGPNPAAAVQLGPVVYRQDVLVTNGLFVTLLDFGAVFHGEACWLEISVGRDGEALTPLVPLQPLTAVPQALYGEDADANPSNEYNTALNLIGTTLQITDGGGTLSRNLGSLVNDQDWLYFSGSGSAGEIYHAGNVALGSLTNPDGYGLNVQNYTPGRAAVRGVEQNESSVYSQGLLGVYNSSNLYGLPIHVLNAGVLGLKPPFGASGAAVYGWNNDVSTTNYGGIFVASGGGGTNYALYAVAQNGTQQNVAGYFGGLVGVRELLPEADLHILQTGIGTTDAGGVIFEAAANQQWKIKHTGTHFSFIENNVRRAYIEAGTGDYVTVSDETLKAEITPAGSMLARVLQLAPVTYRYRGQPAGEQQFGFIAQEVAPLFPELVHTAEDGTLGLDYSEFSVLAIAALQEQQSQIEALRADNAALRADLETLRVALSQEGGVSAMDQTAEDVQFAAFGGGRELLNRALDQVQMNWSLLPFLALFALLVWLTLRGRGPEVGR